MKYISPLRKINSCEWQPKKSDVICSDHFIGKIKSNEELSPGYIPSVFCTKRKINISEAAAVSRHARIVKRRSMSMQRLQTVNRNEDKSVEGNIIERDVNADMVIMLKCSWKVQSIWIKRLK